jgi:demethylmenaquinone methyltransferase/2-methoxy-6-polyprenyl-1,4-benzoquinol methylase
MYKTEKSKPAENPDSHAWNDQLLQDPHTVLDKRKRIQNMFAAIAPSYDLNNRLHSLWMDQAWRRKAVKLANVKPTDRVVDVACGTGDLTEAFRQAGDCSGDPLANVAARYVGVDFTFEMLPIALRKSACYNFASCIRFVNGDAQSLPLPGAFADIISIAFGIRNVQDPAKALSEFRRVLRPGGRLIILEFSLPTNPILRSLYNFYFRQILPRTATLISGDKTGAYKYLPRSVNTFISREMMVQMMGAAGFENIEQFSMTCGVCVCYRGVMPDPPAPAERSAEADSPVGVL